MQELPSLTRLSDKPQVLSHVGASEDKPQPCWVSEDIPIVTMLLPMWLLSGGSL